MSKNTVRSALRSETPPSYSRPPRESLVDPMEPRIRELLQAYPAMPATVIAERIGWTHSIRVLRDRVAELRTVYLPPDPARRPGPSLRPWLAGVDSSDRRNTSMTRSCDGSITRLGGGCDRKAGDAL